GPETVHCGIDVIEYFRAQAAHVLPAFRANAPRRSANLKQRVERKIGEEWIGRNDLRRLLGDAGFSADDLDAAIDALHREGKIEVRDISTGGRSRTEYRSGNIRDKGKVVPEGNDLPLIPYFPDGSLTDPSDHLSAESWW